MTTYEEILGRSVDRERRHQQHREIIMAKYESLCHLCNKPYADSIDHVVPVKLGGSDHPDNLRPAHTSCNSQKGANSFPIEALEVPTMWIQGQAPNEYVRQGRTRPLDATNLEKFEVDRQKKQIQQSRASDRAELAAFLRHKRKKEQERQSQLRQKQQRDEVRKKRAKAREERRAQQERQLMRERERRVLLDSYKYRRPEWLQKWTNRLEVVTYVVASAIATIAFAWVSFVLDQGSILGALAAGFGWILTSVVSYLLHLATFGLYEEKLQREHWRTIPEEAQKVLGSDWRRV